LSVGVTPIVSHDASSRRVASTSWVEVLLSCAAIALLWPLFAVVGGDMLGREGRFAEPHRSVALPADVLPLVCHDYARSANRALAAEACGVTRMWASSSAAGLSSRLVDALARVRAATGSSALLACMSEVASRAPSDEGREAYANAALLAGAALNGRRIAIGDATLPAAPRSCAGASVAQSLDRIAATMFEARRASTSTAKNEAMRELLRTAGLQWAVAMLLGLLLVTASRSLRWPFLGAGIALIAWAAAGWAARVPWPFAGDHQFLAARAALSFASRPAPFVIAIAGAGIIVVAIALVARPRAYPQAAASRFGYPGFVLATGIGLLVLLDLSANASIGNRYLALYHQGHLWLAMIVLSVVAMLRQVIGRALAWTLSMIDGVASGIGARIGAIPSAVMLIALAAAISIAFGTLFTNMRQVTSELGRLWLIGGAAWFFFMRGTPLADRLARSGSSISSLVRYVMPLAFVTLTLIGAMVVTRDMGPLLIAGYAAGAFLAASIAMWLQQRYATVGIARAAAVLLFIAWIVGITAALFELGAIDDVTAGRLENLAAPLASANDQLALVTWFQQVAPPAGFGLGAVPWCGYGGGVSCAGVPAQIQSDYTFTALVGVFGWTAAWTITVGCAWWLHRLIARHARATRGEPRLVAMGTRMVNDEQALLSWIAVTWVVLALCQLAVTVAGNLAVIPLTGVTFPFVSFGMTSLVAGAAMLGLCLSINVPDRQHET
jgi:cell division protein FtsW (lipid II flippase)